MIELRHATSADRDFWHRLDGHLHEEEYAHKVARKQAYVICEDGNAVGVLRYGLFWDNTPFLNMIFLAASCRGRGIGTKAMLLWEEEMQVLGYRLVMTSTQVDERAQNFYRRLGYRDCGCLMINSPVFDQPMEMFLAKNI